MSQQESHLRSVLKGITWRFISTGTLILIVYLVQGDISTALEIGAIEFVSKFFIYYLHERAWNLYLQGKEQTRKISVIKTLVWRVVASSTTFVIAYFVMFMGDTGEATTEGAATVAGIEFVTKIFTYYAHERIWQMIPPGAIRKILGR